MKILEIDRCAVCAYFADAHCKKANKAVLNADALPGWCPLPDPGLTRHDLLAAAMLTRVGLNASDELIRAALETVARFEAVRRKLG